MKYLSHLCIAATFALGLVSCDTISGNSGGTPVNEPTVDQMTEMEKQWGIKPHEGRSRQMVTPGEGEIQATQPRAAAPQIVTPNPAPLPQTQTAPPPVFEQPQSATPAQIQKLKN